MKFAFDAHMHIVPLQHACLSLVVDFTKTHPKEETFALASAPNYLIKNIIQNPDDLLNLLNVMERNPADEIAALDDDLRGEFSKNITPLVSGSGINLTENLNYDYLVICPQIMDFDNRSPLSIGYNEPPRHDIFKQAAEILNGMHDFRISHPKSRFIIRPFLGINPLQYSEEKINNILETYFGKKSGWSPMSSDAVSSWKKSAGKHKHFYADENHIPYKNAFAGIKVYPPLGFDPWPDDYQLRSKCELVYSFCESNDVPIVSHCDDQGFRTIPIEDSFLYTSPERWSKVLEKYPNLYLDLAHFGKQYYKGLRFRSAVSWQTKLLELIKNYPHVYSDFSFNGVDSNTWESILNILEESSSEEREKYESRFMFGTDWPLSLTKIHCALSYWRGFAESGLSESLKNKIVSENPASFMFR